MIRLIVDSTSYITKEYAEANNITILPLTISLAGKEYLDTDVDKNDEFFELMRETGEYPKTSQPNMNLIMQTFKDVVSAGDEAIVLTISQTLSGTNNACCVVKNEVDTTDCISIVDSDSTGQTMFLYAMEVVEMIKTGHSRAQILDRLDHLKKESYIEFTPESLIYLKMGGRIGKINALLGSLLQIKPILCFKNGVLQCAKKAIGMRRAMADMIERIPAKVKKIFVLQTAKTNLFEEFKQKIKQLFKQAQIFEGQIGPAVGAHVGPAMGVACLVD